MSAAKRPALPAPSADWAYFFDLDGTLVEIEEGPAQPALDGDLLGLIARLFEAAGGAVAVISGRSLVDIDRLTPGVRLPAAGQHGVERRDATGTVSRHALSAERLDVVRARLEEAVLRHPDLVFEDKGLSMALHYRRAPRLAGFAHRLMRSLRAELGDEYCVQKGKRVVEMKPVGRDKGIAVLEFMREPPFRDRTPVFVGDDMTDEYGFETVNRLGGHSVKVGPGRTVARWRLRDVRAVRAWLDQESAPRSAPRHGVWSAAR